MILDCHQWDAVFACDDAFLANMQLSCKIFDVFDVFDVYHVRYFTLQLCIRPISGKFQRK